MIRETSGDARRLRPQTELANDYGGSGQKGCWIGGGLAADKSITWEMQKEASRLKCEGGLSVTASSPR